MYMFLGHIKGGIDRKKNGNSSGSQYNMPRGKKHSLFVPLHSVGGFVAHKDSISDMVAAFDPVVI